MKKNSGGTTGGGSVAAETPVVRVLPADVYDALELSAWVFGGIGAGRYHDGDDELITAPLREVRAVPVAPVCAFGHAAFHEAYDESESLVDALVAAGIGDGDNDDAVHAINARHGNAPNARVPFAAWCRELNVVRGS